LSANSGEFPSKRFEKNKIKYLNLFHQIEEVAEKIQLNLSQESESKVAYLRTLATDELLKRTKSSVECERVATAALIDHLIVVDERRAYATLKYLSLFDYLTKGLKLSDGLAGRRGQAVRAAREHPELKDQIAEGDQTITNIAQVHIFIRKSETSQKEKWSEDEKIELCS
jgi:hypothetical protein